MATPTRNRQNNQIGKRKGCPCKCHDGIREDGSISPLILDLGTRLSSGHFISKKDTLSGHWLFNATPAYIGKYLSTKSPVHIANNFSNAVNIGKHLSNISPVQTDTHLHNSFLGHTSEHISNWPNFQIHKGQERRTRFNSFGGS